MSWLHTESLNKVLIFQFRLANRTQGFLSKKGGRGENPTKTAEKHMYIEKESILAEG